MVRVESEVKDVQAEVVANHEEAVENKKALESRITTVNDEIVADLTEYKQEAAAEKVSKYLSSMTSRSNLLLSKSEIYSFSSC